MTKTIIERHRQYLEARWEHEGIECAILHHPRFPHCNGYARLPDALAGCDVEELFEIHGGINYGPDEEGWIGFDTAHADDVWPDLPDPLELRTGHGGCRCGTVWTIKKLSVETNRLAKQVALALEAAAPQ